MRTTSNCRNAARTRRIHQAKWVSRMADPVVERIAPQLPGLAEVVGRHTGLHGEAAVVAQLEQLAVGPHVGGVVRHVDGQVADQLHLARRACLAQCVQLREEQILLHVVPPDLRGEVRAPEVERHRIAQGRTRLPLRPRQSVVCLLERHEQRVVVQPVGLGLHERAEARVRDECGHGAVEQPALVRHHPGKVHAMLGQRRRRARHGDEQRVAGKGGEALVRRVAVPRGAEREHLPVAHPHLREALDEPLRLGAQVADAVASRERGGVQQDAGRAREGLGGRCCC